jgi:hypothetical protein
MKKSFNIQELFLHPQQVRTSWDQAHARDASLSRAFQRHQEHDLKHRRLVDLVTTRQKQNYLPS